MVRCYQRVVVPLLVPDVVLSLDVVEDGLRFFCVSVLPLPWALDDGPVAVLPLPDALVVDAWPLEAPWLILDVEFTSVDVWFAEVELLVVLLPLPMFTPSLLLL